MALQTQQVEIDLRGGVDTKTTPKKLGADKMRALENVTFDEVGALVKRYGFEAVETGVTAKNIGARGKQLVGFGGTTGVDAYATTQSAFETSLGAFSDIEVEKQKIGGSLPTVKFAGSASKGGYRAFVVTKASGNATSFIIIDEDSGTVIQEETITGEGQAVAATPLYFWVLFVDSSKAYLGWIPIAGGTLQTTEFSNWVAGTMLDLVVFSNEYVAVSGVTLPPPD
jgi:hypothetical protein